MCIWTHPLFLSYTNCHPERSEGSDLLSVFWITPYGLLLHQFSVLVIQRISLALYGFQRNHGILVS